ncbi:MAG: hypothetical protein CMK89_14105 [Pseudomonadales bacterium]|nr:hypothetical protein [Pseudomonadales bacterium]
MQNQDSTAKPRWMPLQGLRLGRRLVRIHAILLVMTCLLLVGLGFYADHINAHEFDRQVQETVSLDLTAIRARLEGQLNTEISAMQGLVTALTVHPDMDQTLFERFAQPILDNAKLIRHVSAARDMVVNLVYPLTDNSALLGMNLAESPLRQAAMQRLLHTGKPVVAGPLPLRRGGNGLVVRFPVYIPDPSGTAEFWGLVSGVIDTDRFFEEAGLLAPGLALDIAIQGQDALGGDGPVFFGDATVLGQRPLQATIVLPTGSWNLYAIPRGGWPSRAGQAVWLWGAMGVVAIALLIPIWMLLRTQRLQSYQANLLEGLFKLSPLGIALVDVESGMLLDVNPSLTGMLGYDRATLLQKAAEEILPQGINRIGQLEGGPVLASERTLERADGTRLPVRVNGMMVVGKGGRPRFWSIFEDISESKRREQEQENNLRYNRALAELTVNPSVLDGQLDLVKQELVIRMALALDVARASIWLHAENGRELHCIALFERKTETCTEGFVLKQSEYPRYFEAMLQNAHVSVFDAQSDPRTSEFAEGYLKPLGITSMLDAVIPGGSGVVGVICAEHIGPRRNWTQPEEAFVISLATLVGGVYASHERKQTERRLVQATRDAEMAARAKSDFLATMSHEIRTPMNGVLGMLNLLPEQELNPDQRRKVDIAKKSATNLLSLLDDILDFSKVEAGKLDLVQVDFDLRALLDDLAASFALRAQSKGLELVMDLSGVDVSSVHGDPDRLRQIFSNLMSNAVKFTDRGEVVVRCRLEPEPKGYRLLAKVLDSGIGIPKAKQDKLFSPFVQVDASTTRKYGGTGLGLAICRKLCELMGGQINVTSAEGHGTAFSFAVYLKQSEHFESVAPELPAKGFRLLLVDQQARSRETLAKQFNAWGIEVEDVDSSRNALLRLGRADFDLVMVDVADPDYEVFARRLPAEFNGLLCLMTRFDSQLDAAALSAAGYQAYLHKPTSTRQLLQAITLAQLPRAGENEARLLLGQESNGRGAAGEVLLWPQGSRVLLVEDNRINQEVATLMLNAMGLPVDVAENGLRALEQLSHGAAAYNLILMDCQMPEMDGYQATRCIRAGEAGNAYRDIPIIALTANALKGDRQRCLEAGMLDYLTKPIEESRLRELLARYLNPTCSAAEVSGEVIPRAETEWDQAAALKMVRGRQDRLSDLLRIFFDSMPERHQRLDNALICQDLEEVRKVAHSIKGSAGQLHAHSLQDQAQALELAAREGDWQRVEGVLPPFYEAETRFLQQIKNYID